ncbi:uncharacterized protein LACBIDRAFT_334116 [Laccaria bicolor S238N-H82]|uniref:Predicted protein n=1 Tax=Laccaria bicolor (strain S238N-H82 / ATCC MYA-4686) TaxID=486041 RepID=B0DY49_LACBS|nr:uncharacterized protein LACBIDRAFT_334116 [Laccaria bicolor S238N-H82]EDR00458.1 predicted protein [Laccaria bicolor S238N-H82]|eukprot:XP_001888850.1 predicted protein [Laccaria bicolor S238N-H82]
MCTRIICITTYPKLITFANVPNHSLTSLSPLDTFSFIRGASLSGVCQGLIKDLDITGLGSDAKGSSWVTLFTFVALLVSAIAQAANHSISLYNTIIVLYFCYLQLICKLMLVIGSMQKRSMGAPVSEVGLPAKVVFRYHIGLGMASGFMFGLQKGAFSDWFGAVSLVFFGISAMVILSVPVITLAGVGFLLVFLIKAFHPLIGSYCLSAGPRTSFIKILFVNIYIMFCFVVQWIYVVMTIEQTIQRNPVIHNGPQFPITFGQNSEWSSQTCVHLQCLPPLRPAMSVEKLRLMCLLWPDDKPDEHIVEVELDNNWTVAFLKDMIKDNHAHGLADVDSCNLVLWKCSCIPDDDNLEQTLKTLQFDGSDERLVRLTSTHQQISQYFRDQDLSKEPIHILVELPAFESPPPSHKELCITSPSPDLPCSAMLLGQYIRVQEPNVRVIWTGGWKLDDVAECRGWYSYLNKRNGWIPGEGTVFIFDEAQESYKDMELWNELFKGIHDYPDHRAIAFMSYGSPASFIDIQGTRFYIASTARVSLLPTAHEDNLPAVGLLFTPVEFDELVSKNYPDSDYHFHPSFLNMVFEITEGHVGAMYSFLNIILGSNSYHELKHSGQCYTWELFQKTVSPTWFLQQFESAASSVFRRGLPPDDDLRVPAVACVLSLVLCTGSVQDANFTTEDNSSALQLCFSKGWLHTDNIDNKTKYFFLSSLHRWYIEWKLCGILDTTFHTDNDILDFVINVISVFSSQMLSTTQRVSAAGHVQRLPGAQYQDEFYHCCHTHSNGLLVTFPIFGTAKERVKFYIPAKQWGVELLRDDDQIAQHSGQFSFQTGSYGTSLSLTDHIILDYHTTQPKSSEDSRQ